MEDNMIRITVGLAGRKYTLSVKREDEMVIRQATERVNQQIKEYHHGFPGKDIQDILAMILITCSASLEKTVEKDPDTKNIEIRLRHIQQLLAEAV